MLTKGGYREQWGRSDLWYEPFSLVFHPEDFCHVDEIGPGGANLFVIELPRQSFDSLGLAAPTRVLDGAREFPVSLAAIRLYAAHRLGDPLDLPFADMAAALSGVRDSAERARPQWLDRVVELLQEEHSSPLTLVDMARIAGVHPVHLSRTFERFEGCTLSVRLRQLRLKRAMNTMVESDMNLADVALDCGFTDQSHMTRVFGQSLGMTPGQFRLMNRAGAQSRKAPR
jgi:AraC family transcriptional regulator